MSNQTILFTALNAKYIHTNLAVRYLHTACRNAGFHNTAIAEYTINNQHQTILANLAAQQPAAIGFSCYIWNIEMVRRLCSDLKKILPDTVLFLGGPEVTYHSKYLLQHNPAVDFILCGEGEQSVPAFLRFLQKKACVQDVPGLCWRADGVIKQNNCGTQKDLSLVASPYQGQFDKKQYENKILYYETSRGCPYHCGYCLSSAGGVRFFEQQTVFSDFKQFLDAGIKQVKLIDRTFNCNKDHAMRIWQFLKENDNGITNFHFELAAELITAEMLSFFKTLRPGQFQFEIGVQSANIQTLHNVTRHCDLQKLQTVCQSITAMGNIHIHLDLIAGLPYENYESFGRSFDFVYRLVPDQLQLGFLKILHGTDLRDKANELSLVFSDNAPYEILSTPWLSYSQITRLKAIEKVVEFYYNSNRFTHTLQYLLPRFHSPFHMFESLAEFFQADALPDAAQSNFGLAEYLVAFFQNYCSPTKQENTCLLSLLRHDMLLRQNIRTFPDFLKPIYTPALKKQFSRFYDCLNPASYGLNISNRRFEKVSQIHGYAFAVHRPGTPMHVQNNPELQTFLLYDYTSRDFNHNCRCMEISL